MILSEKSLGLLKSLSKISKAVFLEKGKVQRAATSKDTVVCEVTLDEEIPANFGVYDLPAVYNFIKACGQADVEFTGKSLVLTDTTTGMRAVFGAAAKELINTVESMEDIDAAEIRLMFDLPGETLKRMIDLANVNGLPQIAFDDTPEGIVMRLFNASREGSTITIPLTTDKKDASLCIKTPFVASTLNLKIEHETYRVMIAELGFARFESTVSPRRYIISTEVETE